MSDELDARRGEQARQLLEHPLLVEAFDLIEQEYTEQWKSSPARDQDAREKLWLSLKLLHRLRGQLETVVETGKVAQATLAQRALEAAREIGRKFSPD